jgi:hypothetical protein
MDPTYTAEQILAAFKTWYKDKENYSESDAVEAAAYIVQLMDERSRG